VADVGIVLGVAAAAVLWVRLAGAGDDRDVARIALSVGVTLGLLIGGAVLRRADEEGFHRIASVLWFLASLGVGIVVVDAYEASSGSDLPSVTMLGAGVPMLVLGWITHTVDRRAPTMVGAFAGTLTTAIGLVVWLTDDVGDEARLVAVAAVLAAVGIIWLVVALTDRLRPPGQAGVLGAGALLIAPLFLIDRSTGAALLVGVALSAGLMGIGVRLAGSATLIVGAIGLFAYLTGMLIHFFEDSLGVPLVLLIAAVVMIALAAAVVRLRRPAAPPPGS
jgi:hypothetical protein